MGDTSDSDIYFNAFLLNPWLALHHTVLNGIDSFAQREFRDDVWNFTKDTLWSSVDASISTHATFVDNFMKSYDT